MGFNRGTIVAHSPMTVPGLHNPLALFLHGLPTALDSRLWRRASRRRTRALRRCADAHPHRLCCFARTGHIMADAHVFWQLDGSIRVMVYTLVVAHVGALVCSTTTNPSPPIGHATPTGGRYSGACPSARGRRPMQRSRDDRRQPVAPCTRARAPLGERGCYARSVANGARDGECLLAAARVSCVMCPDYGVISV